LRTTSTKIKTIINTSIYEVYQKKGYTSCQPTSNKKYVTRQSYGQLKCAIVAKQCQYWLRCHIQTKHLKT